MVLMWFKLEVIACSKSFPTIGHMPNSARKLNEKVMTVLRRTDETVSSCVSLGHFDASPRSRKKAHALVLILIFSTAIIRLIWLISWTLIGPSISAHSKLTEKVVKHLIWTSYRPNSSVALHGMLIKGPRSYCLKLDVLSLKGQVLSGFQVWL